MLTAEHPDRANELWLALTPALPAALRANPAAGSSFHVPSTTLGVTGQFAYRSAGIAGLGLAAVGYGRWRRRRMVFGPVICWRPTRRTKDEVR
ncbi:MAG TPA: hypothetical protein VN327_14230, partial [Pseudonocardiaceae bacterium]|nr:hypothetical protein [Pseudonocardiaceae bacterium]